MKITGYRLEKYIYKIDRGLADANNPSGEDLSIGSLLFLETDEGVTGIAPAGNEKVQDLFKVIEGQDPRSVVWLWKKMDDFVFKGGNQGEAATAISAIDVALWDLKAKINQEPLWQTLGARHGRTKAYASDIGYCMKDEDIYNFYSKMADNGVDAGKLKIGLSMEDDLRRIGIMKEALSKVRERPFLMVDVNEYWSPKNSIKLMNEIEKHYDIFWIEEPARRWDYRGLRKVSKSVKAAVATGENLNGISDVTSLITNYSVDIINIGVRQLGNSGSRQCANIANAYELPVTMMNCQANYMAHLAAAIPNHVMMEVFGTPDREHVFKSWDNEIQDGFIVMGNSSGLGLEIDYDALRNLQNTDYGRIPNNSAPRRQGAGLEIKPLDENEVNWL